MDQKCPSDLFAIDSVKLMPLKILAIKNWTLKDLIFEIWKMSYKMVSRFCVEFQMQLQK